MYMEPAEQERRFQEALRIYRETEDPKAYEEIWLRVYEACKANAKTILKVSLSDDDFHDRLMDAVATVMRYIKEKGVNPRTLITYCRLPTVGSFFSLKNKRIDREESFEEFMEVYNNE